MTLYYQRSTLVVGAEKRKSTMLIAARQPLHLVTDYIYLFECRLDYATHVATFDEQWPLFSHQSNWQFALLYFDSILLFSKISEKHIVHVRNVLILLSGAGVILELEKCCFLAETVDYLIQLIRSRHLGIASHTLVVIREL